jgi:putative aminopeptidase FrvX
VRGPVNAIVAMPSIHLQSQPPTGEPRPFTVDSVIVDVGTESRDETVALGIELLDPITVPKTVTQLAGTRLAGRSMDDRFDCAALIALTRRALDASNVAPISRVRALMSLAERHELDLRYGATGGGNDGSVFRTASSEVVPIGIPLRYSHSAIETIDTKDLVGLVDLLEAMVRDLSWTN